jgi:hypothetical protein
MPLDHVALRFGGATDADAVDTVYGGVRYDTKHDARWAVFLDAIGIEHAYRPETFRLDRGLSFTPDFWLPTLNAWLVVKPADPETRDSDRWKSEMFSRQHPEFRVWLASGAPRPGGWHLEQLGPTPIARGMLLMDASEPEGRIWVCGSNDKAAQRLVFDAIEIGAGESAVRPRSFPADPNTDSVMRMAYAKVEHFAGDAWKPIGMAGRRAAEMGRQMAGSYSPM